MNGFDLGLGLGAAALCLGLAVYVPFKSRKDRARAQAESPEDEATYYAQLAPGLTHRYRFYCIRVKFSGTAFVLEDADRQQLIEAEKITFGGAVKIGLRKLEVDGYRPGMKVKATGQPAERFESYLYTQDSSLWLKLSADLNGGHKVYHFAYQGAAYTLTWNPARNAWGALGLEGWPATLTRNGTPVAQLIRRDSSSWTGDFSNKIFFGCSESLPPELLAFCGLICCTNFFPTCR